jgi:asparagine synthase (glutamine-hydrolysing)
MCGIAGIVGANASTERALRMRAKLRHRGPDGDGLHVAAGVALAHTRLALVDPEGGAQPLESADQRYVLVYNGEIYNAAELCAELERGWSFRTRCDAEVVLAAYARWGEGCVARLNGMFAFLIWDAVEKTAFAARDLLGVKPFVFAYEGGELLFASEAKAILAAIDRRPTVRLEALLEYLVVPCFSGVEAPMFDGMSYLPPGHFLRVSKAGLTIERWGEYDLHAFGASTREVHPDELAAALERAVRRTLIADAPVGVFLSGGLDSTAIAAFARGTAAFTVSFDGQERFDYARSRIVISDDGPFATLAAATFELKRTMVPVDRAGLASDLAALSRTNDALPAWEQELAQHHLARVASATCKAVLVGDAADETHYGYHFLLDRAATASPRGLIERFAAPILRADVLGDPLTYFDAKYRRLAPDYEVDGTLATSWLIVHRWLPRLLHNGDIHAMAHSLEARVPFADLELLALAQRIGPDRALAGGVEKAVLRESLRGVIPEAIRTRKKSALPKDQDVAGLYQREAKLALDDHEGALGRIIDVGVARALCAPDRGLDERERALLFRITCVGHWLEAYGARLP